MTDSGSTDPDATDPDTTEPDTTTPNPAALAVGDTGPEVVFEDIQRRDFVRYAGASGDFNPVHYDEPYARAAGYPSVFGQGMFTAAIAGRAVTDWFGVATIRQFGIRFQDKVWPGDTLVAICEITDLSPVDDWHRVEAVVRVENQDEELVLTGKTTSALPERE